MKDQIRYQIYIEGREQPLEFTTLDQGAEMLNNVVDVPIFTRHILSNWVSGRSKANKYNHIRLVRKMSI